MKKIVANHRDVFEDTPAGHDLARLCVICNVLQTLERHILATKVASVPTTFADVCALGDRQVLYALSCGALKEGLDKYRTSHGTLDQWARKGTVPAEVLAHVHACMDKDGKFYQQLKVDRDEMGFHFNQAACAKALTDFTGTRQDIVICEEKTDGAEDFRYSFADGVLMHAHVRPANMTTDEIVSWGARAKEIRRASWSLQAVVREIMIFKLNSCATDVVEA